MADNFMDDLKALVSKYKDAPYILILQEGEDLRFVNTFPEDKLVIALAACFSKDALLSARDTSLIYDAQRELKEKEFERND